MEKITDEVMDAVTLLDKCVRDIDTYEGKLEMIKSGNDYLKTMAKGGIFDEIFNQCQKSAIKELQKINEHLINTNPDALVAIFTSNLNFEDRENELTEKYFGKEVASRILELKNRVII